MSDDPVAKKLSQFSPDGSGLDRDALLFAAGRASARPNRRWIALIGALTASQLLTLGLLLWPRHTLPVPDSNTAPVPVVAVEKAPPPERESPGLWRLRERLIEAEGNVPPPVHADEPLIPSAPPLRAFGPFPAEFLN